MEKAWGNWLRRSLGSSSSQPSNARKDMEMLERRYQMIQALLRDAGEIREKSAKLWLSELKDVAYDAEDVLDEFQYELLRLRTQNNRKRKQQEEAEEVWESITPSMSSSFSSRIQKIIQRSDEIVRDRHALRLRGGDGAARKRTAVGLESSHLPIDPYFDRREDEKKNLVDYLLAGGIGVSVLPIFGMRGVGKTTLAQHLFNDPRVTGHFGRRGWVWVSNNFELARLTSKILESLSGSPYRLSELSQLQDKLSRELKGKRFLLVLDDVWNEEPRQLNEKALWERLLVPLKSGAEGSFVIVTTQTWTVAEIMCKYPYYLRCLSDEDCWSLFQKHAFEGQDPKEHPNLEEIGKKIAAVKCKGLPLAAKVLGCRLRFERDEEMWQDILQRDMQDLDDRDNEGVPDIRLHNLPAHLKQCFAYCSLFPKGYVFNKDQLDQLVRLWMAQGFIQSEERNLEDKGSEYFDKFLKRSLFRELQRDGEVAFEMHNYDHDLSQSIAGKEYSRLENACDFSLEARPRHTSLVTHNVKATVHFKSINEALRTILIIKKSKNMGNITIHAEDLNDMFKKLKCLRALDLSFTDIDNLPDAIGNLKHLRYLGLNGTKIRRLPESVCGLYHLQTLEMKECRSLQKLPEGIKNLTKLRHLDFDTHASFCLPAGIGNLTSLQTLPRFTVGRDNGYCGIQELEALGNLRGEVCISGLRNVINVKDAKVANLNKKSYLDKLTLIWPCDNDADSEDEQLSDNGSHIFFEDSRYKQCSDHGNQNFSIQQMVIYEQYNNLNLSEGVEHMDIGPPNYYANAVKEVELLENLQPHTNLTQLVIQSYGGFRFPRWMGDSSFSKLHFVSLKNCNNCKVLPPFGQLPSLEFLEINGMKDVVGVGPEFYRCRNVHGMSFQLLKTLSFQAMPEWKEWCGMEEGDFPYLRKLSINDCPKLRALPDRLSSLTALVELEIEDCAELANLPTLPSVHDLQLCACNALTDLPAFSSLKTLKLQACKGLITFPPLPSLCNLVLCACRGLTDLPILPSLTSLEVMHCGALASLRNFLELRSLVAMHCGALESLSTLPSLEELLIEDCEQLISVHFSSPHASFLRNLEIVDCPQLRFSPDEQLPSTLSCLLIDSCPLINKWCKRHRHSKLAHISNVYIDGRALIDQPTEIQPSEGDAVDGVPDSDEN